MDAIQKTHRRCVATKTTTKIKKKRVSFILFLFIYYYFLCWKENTAEISIWSFVLVVVSLFLLSCRYYIPAYQFQVIKFEWFISSDAWCVSFWFKCCRCIVTKNTWNLNDGEKQKSNDIDSIAFSMPVYPHTPPNAFTNIIRLKQLERNLKKLNKCKFG